MSDLFDRVFEEKYGERIREVERESEERIRKLKEEIEKVKEDAPKDLLHMSKEENDEEYLRRWEERRRKISQEVEGANRELNEKISEHEECIRVLKQEVEENERNIQQRYEREHEDHIAILKQGLETSESNAKIFKQRLEWAQEFDVVQMGMIYEVMNQLNSRPEKGEGV